jgi:chromosome segregation ATPase
MLELQRIWAEIQGNDIAFVFSVGLIGLTFIALVGTVGRGNGRFSKFGRVSPNILTGIGVLGTFTGIFYGLLDFDVQNIDASVPRLLEGLKIAFVTSILGMFGALIVRTIQTIAPDPEETGDVDATDIHAVLREIRDNAHSAEKNQREALSQLRAAIAGDGDSSVVTQIQKLRSAATDNHGELKTEIGKGFEAQLLEFREFAKTMAENNSKALIEALEGVIRDFNTKISEQFGENFKQLNEAVGALLTWQENYRQHVETLTARFEDALKGVDAARDSLREISDASKSIPKTLETVAELLSALNRQTEEMERHLEAFSALRTQASEAFPVIENNLNDLTAGVTKAVGDAVEEIRKTLATQAEAYADIQKGFSGLKDEASLAVATFTDDMDKTVDGLRGELEGLVKEQFDAVRETIGQMRDGFEKAVSASNDVLGQQIENLDAQMQQEVQNVVEVMGSHLASLSGKFVEDYEPLTDKLRAVVRMAEAG